MQLENIKLSIIIPAYNIENYIYDCLKTIFEQNIKSSDYEVIVINDGSTDNTIAKIELFKDRDNIIIVNQKNQGQAVARNNGIKIAKGKYIWFVDGDDQICTNCLKDILNICEKLDPDLFCVGPSVPFIKDFPKDLEKDIFKMYTGEEWILAGYGVIGPWSYIINKKFWEKNKLNFMEGIYYEDTECMSRSFYFAKRIFTLKFSVYNYIQRPGSTMNRPFNSKKLDSNIKIFFSINKFNESVQNKIFKKYYDKICTDVYISGISQIVKNKVSSKIAKNFILSFNNKKININGIGIIQKIYQFILIHYPYLYIKLRRLI